MTRKSPQEKKRLSYLKDRRNTYGENSKSSRKNIRLRKRKINRANRRADVQAVAKISHEIKPERAEQVESRRVTKPTRRWKKKADTPLAEVVQDQLNRRAQVGMELPANVENKIRRIKTCINE